MRRRAQRRRLSMTSLIDVIFLLLLFFMLSSTFSRFAEVELSSASAGGTGPSDTALTFLQLGEDSLSVNGKDETLDSIEDAIQSLLQDTDEVSVVVSLKDDVSSQRLTDLLVVLKAIDQLIINVLGS